MRSIAKKQSTSSPSEFLSALFAIFRKPLCLLKPGSTSISGQLKFLARGKALSRSRPKNCPEDARVARMLMQLVPFLTFFPGPMVDPLVVMR